MEKKYNRIQRVSQEIKKEIAYILHQVIRDPRINMVTVTHVTVSKDFAYSKVFVTFLNDNSKNIKLSIDTLQNASMFIRRCLGKVMYLRIMPELTFIYDNSMAEGIRMTNLISKAIKNDYF